MVYIKQVTMGKAARMSERLFAGVPRFEAKKGRFSPLPWLFRGALSQIPPRTWQIYCYLIMRAGPESICWPTEKQIAHDCGIGPRKVGPHLKALEELGLVVTREHDGLTYFCLVDALVALANLVNAGKLPESVAATLVDDFEIMSPRKPESGTQLVASSPTAISAEGQAMLNRFMHSAAQPAAPAPVAPAQAPVAPSSAYLAWALPQQPLVLSATTQPAPTFALNVALSARKIPG